MTRLSIIHKTGYKYNKRVTLSYNEARMTPLTDPQQVVLESVVKVSPSQAAVSTYRDYWGTRVTAFDMQMPHEHLEVVSNNCGVDDWGLGVLLRAGLVAVGGLGRRVSGLGDLRGQIGGQGGQLDGLGHRLGGVRRTSGGGHCQGAEDATGNSGAQSHLRRAAAGLPVAGYVSGVGHENNRYQGHRVPFKKRVLRHSCPARG